MCLHTCVTHMCNAMYMLKIWCLHMCVMANAIYIYIALHMCNATCYYTCCSAIVIANCYYTRQLCVTLYVTQPAV
jgi:hypothetical protein